MIPNSFDEQYYFQLYPDVKQAVAQGVFPDGYSHFLAFGEKEGRYAQFKEKYTNPNALKPSIKSIYDWIAEMVTMPNPIIIEIGANDGQDTIQLAAIKGAIVHAFEPEPRCDLSKMPKNVIVNKCAVSNNAGFSKFYQSDAKDYVHTYSGSLRKPKNHLTAHPHVKFKTEITVPVVTLDEYCKKNKIDHIDFLYMDVQGSEYDVFEGAKEILKNTKLIYTEYSNEEMYAGQKNLDDLQEILGNYFVLDDWPIEPSNVLLQNINCL